MSSCQAVGQTDLFCERNNCAFIQCYQKKRLFWHFFPIQHEARLENKLHFPSLVFLFAWLRSRSRSRTPSSTQTHRSNNNVRMLPLRNSSSVALLWFYTCLENKFLKLLNSWSRNKDEWTIQLARCWLAQWDQYGPQEQLLVLMDGRTDKSCLGRTSVSV